MTRTEGYRPAADTQADMLRSSRNEIPAAAAPGIAVATTKIACGGCGIPTKVRLYGRPGHWKCLTSIAATPEPEVERESTPEEVSMFRLLQESITASRKRPVLRIAKDERDREPWNLVTERMRGEHRYRIDAPAGRTVKTLDRNGSYPSAMANVPVAAGTLVRRGQMGFTTGHAGVYRIPAFPWNSGPHPLGEISEQESELWWISTPHLKLCMRLAAHGRIEPPRIVDSWVGNSVTNLFKVFSADVSALREQARGTDAYGEIKRKSSIAIRGLWPKSGRSPFWRPDWSVSVRAEAAVRHWVRADQAATAGAELVRLGNVDEAAFLVPPRARAKWLPEPYVEGTAFGYVTVKSTALAAEWNRPRHGKR
jgi:hypothetical protein